VTELAVLADKVGQVSELYATRNAIERDADWYALKLQEELGELVSAYLRRDGRGRAKGEDAEAIARGLADEAADVFAQLLLFCTHNHIDIEAALERKWFSRLDAHPQKTKTE